MTGVCEKSIYLILEGLYNFIYAKLFPRKYFLICEFGKNFAEGIIRNQPMIGMSEAAVERALTTPVRWINSGDGFLDIIYYIGWCLLYKPDIGCYTGYRISYEQGKCVRISNWEEEMIIKAILKWAKSDGLKIIWCNVKNNYEKNIIVGCPDGKYFKGKKIKKKQYNGELFYSNGNICKTKFVLLNGKGIFRKLGNFK